jgi:acetolactate synthase I/II/III large subunit
MATRGETQPAAAEAAEQKQPHGGLLAARRLKARGLTKLFTLSGGHLFSLYDGCRSEGIELVDFRHESAAAFAAEGWSKVTRTPGVCALTAGPGVTNGMSAIASAHKNNSPMVVLGGRAPQMRWGQGSLQEIDHVPFVRPLTRSAQTAFETAEIGELIDESLAAALRPPTGPAFLDLPLDVVFMEAEESGELGELPSAAKLEPAPADAIEEVASLLAGAERPVIMAGTDLYWGHGEVALRDLSEALGIPVFLNGLARGCLAADHPNFFSRARGAGLKGADVALVIGVPMDFRLGFGGSFGEETQVVQVDAFEPERDSPRALAGELYGGLPATLSALREAAIDGGASVDQTAAWRDSLRETESEKRAKEEADLNDDRAPLHPLRIYKELREVLDRNAVVIGDGGDFVSYAGRVVETYETGCWLDPGPFGCLGSGPGYAIAAKVARPERQVCLLLGDGAFGFSGMEFDTMVRHGLPVVAVVGNNGIWALEKHPMEFLYGYSVAAELRPGTRYDQVVEALGGHGELVEKPEQLRPALDRAFASGKPACVNVLTDPTVVYPRSANLA